MANMDRMDGNEYSSSSARSTAARPANRLRENTYAAGTAVPIASATVATVSSMVFRNQTGTGSSENTRA